MEGAPPDLWIPPSCCPVDLCRGFVFEGLVGALLIVVAEEAVEAGEQLLWILVAAQVDVLVLDGAPEPFDEDIVHPTPAPVHADPYLRVPQDVQEGVAGELRPLVGVEDLGFPVAVQGFLQRLAAEVGREAVGRAPPDAASSAGVSLCSQRDPATQQDAPEALPRVGPRADRPAREGRDPDAGAGH